MKSGGMPEPNVSRMLMTSSLKATLMADKREIPPLKATFI